MKRIPIAHVIFPRPNLARPVPEFAWEAARRSADTPDLDVTVYMPVPLAAARPLSGAARRRRGASAWPAGLEGALLGLEPRPVLVPYLPVPRRSTEAAAAALAVHLLGRPRPAVVQGSFLDEGGYAATRVARVLGCPSVVVAHGTDVRAARGEVPGVGRTRRARAALWGADRVLAMSHAMAQDLAGLGVRAAVLPFTSAAERFRLARHFPRGRHLLFVGKLSVAKGVPVLLEAFARLAHRDATLRLVGPRADYPVEAEVARLGLEGRVTVLPEVPQEDLPKLYGKATCLVLPSQAEGLPCVAVEALLVGRPVVATRVGGLPELVDRGRGALVEVGDVAGLAAALDALLEQVSAGMFDPEALRAGAMPYAWESSGPRLGALVRGLLG